MIVWRWKRGEYQKKVVFDAFKKENSSYWKVSVESDISVWKYFFGDVSSRSVVTVLGVTFIPSDDLKPEIVEESENVFKYYLIQSGIKIIEIPVQSSDTELLLEIFERSISLFAQYF